MKPVFCLSVVVLALIACTSCKKKSLEKPYALYDWFEYQGNDSVFSRNELSGNEYQNPVFAGFYPDPSICRVDSDYYMVNSSFSYYPGIPIFKSRDLVHWKQIGHVLDRPSQLNLDSLGLSWGVFAPAISYNKGIYYVINTLVNGGGNFYVTATDPKGPWSDPVWLPVIDGIDPSFFFDENGKAYVVNNGPPEGTELYSGHRAIWIQEFRVDSGKLTGPRKIIVNAGVNIKENPVWIEGPHILKNTGFYYLIAAEGGTSTGHSEVVFRSKSVWGPYVPAKRNPILTQRHLSNDRPDPITSTGHADFVQTPGGEWWSVFLGCRPYEDDLYNTGRETFMMPVKWENGWPYITEEPIPYKHQRPDLKSDTENGFQPMTGNFIWRDDFNDSIPGMLWNYIRTPRIAWLDMSSEPGFTKIELQPVSIREWKNPSFIGRRQQHIHFTASTSLKPVNFNDSSTAGIMAFQNDQHYLYLGMKKTGKDFEIFLERAATKDAQPEYEVLASTSLSYKGKTPVFLRIEGKGKTYDFFYALVENDWKLLKDNVDASNLSTNKAGGFVGTYLGMYGSVNHNIKPSIRQ